MVEMGEAEYELNETSKKGRKRKKQLYNRILQQMEFYFSNANLTKDRFLAQLLRDSPYVDVKIFMNFNKIKKLNCTIDDIRKAISNSELIELSEDKEKICRKQPVTVKKNVDECTIYVENLKVDCDHEWLSQLFSEFGKIDYVSIPKYTNNKGIKGFAFIEFEKESDAQNALDFFDSIGCKMPSDTNPDDLRSIKTFEAKNQDSETPVNKKITFEEADDQDKSIKRRLSDESPEIPKKKHKIEAEEEESDNVKKRKLSEDADECVNKKVKAESEENLGDAETEAQNETMDDENADSKRKSKKHKKDKKKDNIKQLGMQVLSKLEWKKMRNRYLDLQKKKMKEFKQYLYREKFAPKGYERPSRAKDDKVQEESAIKDDALAKLEFVPGVIVKLKLPEPCADVKKLKNEIKSTSTEVKFVDVPLPAGSEEVFVRFSSPESAKEFAGQDFPGEKTVLEQDEEKMYWEKIHNDRSVKFAKSTRKQRGRDKLLKKAEKKMAKHIKFDDGE